MENKIKYEFNHLQTALIAFIGTLEKQIQFVFPDIPVLMENIDDSFILFKKYSQTELQELYNKVPRVIISLQDVQGQLENNTTQFLRTTYQYNDEEYQTQFRRISSALTIEVQFVCSNYLKALSYWEFLLTIFAVDNTFTYNHFGNTFQGSYLLQNAPTVEKPILNNATSDSKNSVVKTTLEINIQPIFINVRTIQKLTDGNFIVDTDIIDDGTEHYSQNEDGSINNSKINSTQELNDLSLNTEEEKRLLKNRKKVKIASNKFDIDVKAADNDPTKTYHTTLKTDIYNNENNE